ncbi:uncharacterized protein [Chelonus insularis]|uniref:uncharacterized protein isoform X2 n=1 Tax=Chelonus insularis TaxID=460826 RepID=UPI001589337B|nr:uncharacterized protein LOC118070489 isoform X2 [Chelonus insularis]
MDSLQIENHLGIQAFNRALQIPSVNYLWDKSTEVYEKVKSASSFTNWALETIEMVLATVIEKSVPVTKLVEKPIHNLDKTLCYGFDFVEVKLPIIREDPKQILDKTKSLVLKRLRPAVQIFIDLKQETKHKVKIITLHTYYRVHYLRVYSWQQADKVMSTETGINILKTVDNTTGLAELMLDKYLPALEDEIYSDLEDCNEPVKLHHTIIRLSEFGSKASKRIYFALMDRLQYMYKIEILLLVLHALIVIQMMKYVETALGLVVKIINDFCILH